MKYPSESVRQKERDAKITFLSTVHKDVLQLQSISEKYDKFLINKNHPLHTGPYWGSQGISIKPLSKPIAKSTPTLDALD